METTRETTELALVIAPAGRLDFGSAAAFQDTLEKGIAEAAAAKLAVIVDCAGLDYLSSAGLRSFLIGARTAQAAGVKLKVCALAPCRSCSGATTLRTCSPPSLAMRGSLLANRMLDPMPRSVWPRSRCACPCG